MTIDEIKEMCQILLVLGIDDFEKSEQVAMLLHIGFKKKFQSTYMTHVFGDPYGDAIRFDEVNAIGERWDVMGGNKGWSSTLQQAYDCRWGIALR